MYAGYGEGVDVQLLYGDKVRHTNQLVLLYGDKVRHTYHPRARAVVREQGEGE